jgi:hypothetical protein
MGGVDVYIHIFLNSALVGGEWWASRPGRFAPRGMIPRYPLDRRLGGPRVGVEAVEKKEILPLPGIEPGAVQPVAIPTELSGLH